MNYVKCLLCGKNNYKILFINRKDKYLNELKSNISSKIKSITVVCKNCGLIYQNPQLEEPEIKELYSLYYDRTDPQYTPEFSASKYLRSRLERNQNRIKWLKQSSTDLFSKNIQRRILDVGCRAGILLSLFKKEGWDTYGIDPSAFYSAIARDKFNLHIIIDFFKKEYFPNNYFDLVTIVQTLEHIKNPIRHLVSIGSVLKENGYIYIEVPNIYKIKNNLNGLFAAPHLYTFSANTLKSALIKLGFEIINIDSSSSDLKALARIQSLKSSIRKTEIECEDYLRVIYFIKHYKKKYFLKTGWKDKLKDGLAFILGKTKGELMIKHLKKIRNTRR